MRQQLLSYKDSQISYLVFGTGPKVVLCFHGYGEEGNSFSFLDKLAGNKFTFISIDLPFHGKTNWNTSQYFQKNDLEIIINIILSENKLNKLGMHKCLTLAGFSIGGRIALCLYEIFPQQVKKIILLAPDGLKVNFWYRFSTQTWLGKRIFAFTMKYPGWFFAFLKALHFLRLVKASIFKFVNYYIDDKEKRLLLYKRWTVLGKLKPDLKNIKKAIRENKTKVLLLYGQHDRVIKPEPGIKFTKGIEEYATITIINSGHQVLNEKHTAEILPLFTGKKDNP